METTNKKLDELSKSKPFKVPTTYFENLPASILSQLPERDVQAPKVVSMWSRVKPWAFAAAVLMGVALVVRTFVLDDMQSQSLATNKQTATEVSATAPKSSEVEELYAFYEDQLANEVYRGTFYTGSLSSE